MDIFYLSIAYLAAMRNWDNLHAFAVARFLFYYRLVGAFTFEVTHDPAVLLVFPNTFEYFFIAYEAIRTRWTPVGHAAGVDHLGGLHLDLHQAAPGVLAARRRARRDRHAGGLLVGVAAADRRCAGRGGLPVVRRDPPARPDRARRGSSSPPRSRRPSTPAPTGRAAGGGRRLGLVLGDGREDRAGRPDVGDLRPTLPRSVTRRPPTCSSRSGCSSYSTPRSPSSSRAASGRSSPPALASLVRIAVNVALVSGRVLLLRLALGRLDTLLLPVPDQPGDHAARPVPAGARLPPAEAHLAAQASSARSRTTRCPRWDSNPDCAAFKTASSAGWDTGARQSGILAALAARPSTSSSIGSVSLPVKVFCWLGW